MVLKQVVNNDMVAIITVYIHVNVKICDQQDVGNYLAHNKPP